MNQVDVDKVRSLRGGVYPWIRQPRLDICYGFLHDTGEVVDLDLQEDTPSISKALFSYNIIGAATDCEAFADRGI
jgi:hypothetical protein